MGYEITENKVDALNIQFVKIKRRNDKLTKSASIAMFWRIHFKNQLRFIHYIFCFGEKM